jgi:hypothetical protein
VYGLNESQRAMAVAKVYPEPEHGAAVAKWARLKLPENRRFLKRDLLIKVARLFGAFLRSTVSW